MSNNAAPVTSLAEYRERRDLERLLRASLGACGKCGRPVLQHTASDKLDCWTALTFGGDGETNTHNEGA